MTFASRLFVSTAVAVAAAASFALPRTAVAADTLTLYCSPEIEWCQIVIEEFQKATGIEVAMTRKSAGESYAQVRAEKDNPKGDIWWGGTGDPHLQAAEEGLTLEYKSPMLPKLLPWAQKQAERSKYRTVGIYMGAVGFGYNTDMLAKRGLPEPKCWADLTKPAYKGEIQMANPNSSGTAWTMLATMVQMMGEDKAFDYLKSLHQNINQYTKSGAAPIKAAGRGETLIGVVFLHDVVTEMSQGFPLKAVAPCEGTGFEIGSMSIIKGARHLAAAKKFYDWALTPEAQRLMIKANAYQVPSNAEVPPPPQAPKVDQIKLIDYDFNKYGSAEERRRLLTKWDKEVKDLPH